MQQGGNRARFFAPQAAKAPDASSVSKNSESSHDGSFMQPSSKDSESISTSFDTGSSTTTSCGALVFFSKQKSSADVSTPHHDRPVTNNSQAEGGSIPQRTHIIEAETAFKSNREGHGRLNVSGLIKHVDLNSVKPAHQSTIKEVVEHEDLSTRSPRQYPGSKLISKSNASSYSPAVPQFTPPPPPTQRTACNMPPSNQLASQAFKVPPHHTQRSDISAEDTSTIKQMSVTSHTDTSNSHISTRSPANRSEDSIKSLTSAFNKKHSGAAKNLTPKFASPVSHPRNSSGSGRAYSPHVPFEDDLPTNTLETFEQRSLRIKDRNFSSEICDDGNFEETTSQTSERYHESAQLQHGLQGQHRKRGEKRTSDPDVDDESVRSPLGKKARVDPDHELPFRHGSNSSMTSSPELGQRDNCPFKRDIPQDFPHISRGAPQLKIFSGQDVDEYVAIHMDRYEAARKRWIECSGEEWEKGADELVDKFTKILDFVKEQMKRRVTLYASLHAKIDQHQKERGETSEMLKNARSRLVVKTGIVVGEGKL